MNNWISIADSNPAYDEVVLVRLSDLGAKIRHGNVDTDMLDARGGWKRWQGYVTHWMPLPDYIQEVPHE